MSAGLDWAVGVGISFSTNGQKIFGDLNLASAKLNKSIDILLPKVEKLDGLLTNLGRSADAAAAGVGNFATASDAAARSTGRTTSALRSTCTAYRDAAVAANAAAASVERFNAMVALSRGSMVGPRASASAVNAALPILPSAANALPAIAPPRSSSMKWVGQSLLGGGAGIPPNTGGASTGAGLQPFVHPTRASCRRIGT
jgi:hypothetical protein